MAMTATSSQACLVRTGAVHDAHFYMLLYNLIPHIACNM